MCRRHSTVRPPQGQVHSWRSNVKATTLVSAPYLLYHSKDLYETWYKCLTHWADVQKAWYSRATSRSRSLFNVKFWSLSLCVFMALHLRNDAQMQTYILLIKFVAFSHLMKDSGGDLAVFSTALLTFILYFHIKGREWWPPFKLFSTITQFYLSLCQESTPCKMTLLIKWSKKNMHFRPSKIF